MPCSVITPVFFPIDFSSRTTMPNQISMHGVAWLVHPMWSDLRRYCSSKILNLHIEILHLVSATERSSTGSLDERKKENENKENHGDGLRGVDGWCFGFRIFVWGHHLDDGVITTVLFHMVIPSKIMVSNQFFMDTTI